MACTIQTNIPYICTVYKTLLLPTCTNVRVYITTICATYYNEQHYMGYIIVTIVLNMRKKTNREWVTANQ